MEEYEAYICARGETFDGIALKTYGDEQWAGILLEANGQHAHKVRMEGGETLRLPETGATPPTLPPWRCA